MIQKRCLGRRSARAAHLLLAALLAAPLSHAAAVDDASGVYLGAQVYNARFSRAGSFGSEDISGGLTLGWRFNRSLGLEASVKKTHLVSMSIDPSGKGIHGIELALRGQHDFNDRFAATAKAGVYDWRQAGLWPYDKSGTDAVVGAGLMLRLSAHTSLTSEYQRILGFEGGGDEDLVGLGVRVDFD